MQTITTEKLQRLQKDTKNLTVVNVLDQEKFSNAHIPGSENVPSSRPDFAKAVEALAGGKDKPVVVYCGSLDCDASPKAAQALEKAGFTQVIDYEGGVRAWKEAGLPLEGQFADQANQTMSQGQRVPPPGSEGQRRKEAQAGSEGQQRRQAQQGSEGAQRREARRSEGQEAPEGQQRREQRGEGQAQGANGPARKEGQRMAGQQGQKDGETQRQEGARERQRAEGQEGQKASEGQRRQEGQPPRSGQQRPGSQRNV